jgi:hypothetical protein
VIPALNAGRIEREFVGRRRADRDVLATLTDEVESLGGGAVVLAGVIGRILYLLDSANVDVTTATLQRRDAKRAAKRGWRTASTIAIRHRISTERRDPTGATRDYRVQFEVSGHYKHVQRGPHVRCAACAGRGQATTWRLPDGRTVDGPGVYEVNVGTGVLTPTYVNAVEASGPCGACRGTGLDPEKVKPCARRFTSGPAIGTLTCPDGCRREWVPTHVKGNPDAPLQLKTRRLPGAPS